ncbi:aldehyde dehydrogenase family protein [Pseudonocardia dioxanivorans]|uniref:aldehyde dehydrogenase family protein n=1 Tax=Pseudonocardia dioxanivorans TaxID=240495 RepID=UPI00131A4F50|nr:aldehyde dehydrogenase family protein [Pseudonocardia dioxanivorans]
MSDRRTGFFIDGEFVESSSTGRTVDVVAPATEEVAHRVPEAGDPELDRAVAAARRAFDEGPWPRLSPAERAAVVLRACDLLDKRVDDAAHLQADEMGAPLSLGRFTGRTSIDVTRELCAAVVGWSEVDARDGQWEYEVRTEPYGVVAAISPWNGPFAATLMKGTMALLAGCTVVDKPPVEAPLSSLVIAEALADAGLPAGAFNLVPGDGRLGERLVSSPGVDMVSFTGGTVVGKQVGRICGEQLKRVVLELGGKSAGVVLPDGDMAAAVRGVASGVFFNTGQVCSSLTRLLVPHEREEEAVAGLVEFASRMKLGDPHDESTQVGPLATRRHRDRVESYVRLGVAEGAELVTGGARPAHLSRGWFFEPTVFRGVTNTMRLGREEVFGPVASVLTYRDVDEAVAIANDSPYGLNASVFSADEEHALRVAARLRTGAVTINDYAQNFSAPRYHIKDSGIGVRTGREGYEQHRLAKLYNLRPSARANRNATVVGE